ncbi:MULTISPECIES: DUF2516 family protein [unclassified Actinotalea]|uniref:DUF2516 family protein n=1 Tax=unclassified Actinotalea TaxID=2638618 RepID=UPI0015F40BA0|nr:MULTISPECIES: DUF2516 family protein [unclassified Actinotalea]
MIASIQVLIFLALYVGVFAACVVALIDLVRRPAGAFVAAGKKTKTFWGALLGVATAIAFVAIPYPLGIGELQFLALGSAVAAIVYLVDVRPAMGSHGRGGPRRPGPRAGGW